MTENRDDLCITLSPCPVSSTMRSSCGSPAVCRVRRSRSVRAVAPVLVLALAVPAAAADQSDIHVRAAWAPSARATRVAALTLTGVPAKSRVELLCRGGGCTFTRKVVAMHGSSRVGLARAFKGARLRVGAVVQIRVTAPTLGVVLVRYTMRSGKPPRKERTWLTTSTGTPPPPPSPAPPVPPGGTPPPGQPPAQSRAQQALAVAQQYLGTLFAYGGASPATGFDDDGLVQYAYGQVGVQLPRVAYQQFGVGASVAVADLRPGDLVFFQDTSGYVDHVGLFAGDGQFLHAPHTGDVIKYSSLSEPYYAQRFAGARRVAD